MRSSNDSFIDNSSDAACCLYIRTTMA